MGTKGSRAYLSLLFLFAFIVNAFLPFKLLILPVAEAKSEPTINYLSAVHFIDVGQGDCTFIELPNGETVLIDSGRSEYSGVVVGYIKNLGYQKIDCIIATHSDADHIGALGAVLTEFEVRYIFRPYVVSVNASILGKADDLEGVIASDEEVVYETSDEYATFIKLAYEETYNGAISTIYTLSDKAICDVFYSTEDVYYTLEIAFPIAIEDAYFTSITGRTSGYKIPYYNDEDKNTLSAVVLYSLQNEIAERKFLFMADATLDSEAEIINKANNNEEFKARMSNVDVLKVAHHGSKYSTGEELLNLIKPRVAVVSVGTNNSYGHPAQETLSRLSQYCPTENIFRTDIGGTVVIKYGDDGNLWSFTKKVSMDDPIPDWVLYLVLGIIVLSVIAIVIVNIIKNKINKSKSDGENENNNDDGGMANDNSRNLTTDIDDLHKPNGKINLIDPFEE